MSMFSKVSKDQVSFPIEKMEITSLFLLTTLHFYNFLGLALFSYFFKHFDLILFLLLFASLFVTRSVSSIDHMGPVLLCVFGQPSPSFDDKYTRITNIPFSRFLKSEAI